MLLYEWLLSRRIKKSISIKISLEICILLHLENTRAIFHLEGWRHCLYLWSQRKGSPAHINFQHFLHRQAYVYPSLKRLKCHILNHDASRRETKQSIAKLEGNETRTFIHISFGQSSQSLISHQMNSNPCKQPFWEVRCFCFFTKWPGNA